MASQLLSHSISTNSTQVGAHAVLSLSPSSGATVGVNTTQTLWRVSCLAETASFSAPRVPTRR
jgi:hypothetical protein